MGKKLIINKREISYYIYFLIGILVLTGCATFGVEEPLSEESKAPVVKSVKIYPYISQTIVEIINDRPAPYTTFKLIDPPRIVMDIRGIPSEDLPKKRIIDTGSIKDITFEEGETQIMTTRLVIGLSGPVDYHVESEDSIIRLNLTPKPEAEKGAKPEGIREPKMSETAISPSEPRIFIKPKTSALNQVLGIDFTMLDHGKSRLIVSTDKKINYDMERKGPKTLFLKMSQTVIPSQLLRPIDPSQFMGAVERVTPSSSDKEKAAALAISLKEMVPFHVKQTEKEITIDFGATSVKAVEKKMVPLQQVQSQVEPTAVASAPGMEKPPEPTMGLMGGPMGRKYSGAPMTLDFVDADITNILRLIGEVSNLNIVWGQEVKGKKVSMRLKGVPWDQALDLILTNNDLAQRMRGNVIWITTQAKLRQVEAEERRKRDEIAAKIENERQKVIAEKEKKKEQEPLITEYIGLDFATADEIKAHIKLSARGSMSTDARTNTIILKDIASVIEEAKKIVSQFDTPVKQVMIEARIVDATDTFTRELGVQWGTKTQFQTRNNPTTSWAGTPEWAPANVPAAFQDGGSLYNPSVTSITPATLPGYSSNFGLVFSKLDSFGMTGLVLDAHLALAETEGKVRVISAPKILASNGEEATISRGDSIVIAATENVESTTLDATLSLTVTPTVSFNDYVTMQINVTDDNAPSATLLQRKSISTKLMVKSGDTIVIGGIFKDDTSNNESGIPGLSRIPLLGWLFKTQAKSTTKTELLIFITPTVLPSYKKSQ